MKNINILILVLLVSGVNAQVIEEPNYGIAVTGTGMTLCAVGTTMRQSAQIQYSPRYGTTHISYDSHNNRSLRLSTMAVGAIITLTGIIIQNRKRKTNYKPTIKI